MHLYWWLWSYTCRLQWKAFLLALLALPLSIGGLLALTILPTLSSSILNLEICRCCGNHGFDLHLHLSMPLVLLYLEVINYGVIILGGHVYVCVVFLYSSCRGALDGNLFCE